MHEGHEGRSRLSRSQIEVIPASLSPICSNCFTPKRNMISMPSFNSHMAPSAALHRTHGKSPQQSDSSCRFWGLSRMHLHVCVSSQTHISAHAFVEQSTTKQHLGLFQLELLALLGRIVCRSKPAQLQFKRFKRPRNVKGESSYGRLPHLIVGS